MKFSVLKKSSLNMVKITDWSNVQKKKKISPHLMEVHELGKTFVEPP